MTYDDYLQNITRPIIILDKLHQVVTISKEFLGIFPKIMKGENIYIFEEDYPIIRKLVESNEGYIRFRWAEHTYNAEISFISVGKKNRPIARCIVLTDITDIINILEETTLKNMLLHSSNQKINEQNDELKKTIEVEQKDALIRAQALLLRNIHDTLGHSLTMIGALFSLAINALPNEAASLEKLHEARRLIGISIADLESAGDFESGSFVSFLYKFKKSMASIGIQVILTIRGLEQESQKYMYIDLMRICLEASTNAIKHGKATMIRIVYIIKKDEINLTIHDNGRAGSTSIKNGHGLVGMDERVNNLFGDFMYGFVYDGSFLIDVIAPIITK
ncbi:MAG: hypothetical protein LBN22_02425 [Clostridiales Family XIII bacterium]|jgi:signal transduction histidine kinase|nr:hypothetical protein [Clostridiales Family XIII bacterium]